MSERMTAEELIDRWIGEHLGTISLRGTSSHDLIVLIEADRRETERLCAERAVKWVNLNLADMHMPLMLKRLEEGELIAAITLPAKEDTL